MCLSDGWSLLERREVAMPTKLIQFCAMFLVGWFSIGLCASLAGGQTVPASNHGEYRPSGYSESYQGMFYPGAELRALPPARAQAAATSAHLHRAEVTLTNTLSDARRASARSREMIDALT